jgi:hypothetical protein
VSLRFRLGGRSNLINIMGIASSPAQAGSSQRQHID